MSPLSKAALVQARNDSATRTTTVTSLHFKPTMVVSPTGRLQGYRVSVSNVSSILAYQTVLSAGVASATPSAALTNHSTPAAVTFSSTHIVPVLYKTTTTTTITTTTTLETGLYSPTSHLTVSANSAIPTSEQTQNMSLETKIGLALIPIAVGLCTWALVLLFLWRKRKMHESHHQFDLAPVPEKSHSNLMPSLGSIRNTRVFTMAAFHSREDRGREALVVRQGSEEHLHAAASTPPRVRRTPSGTKEEAWDPDSPIDEESPYKLRRSETRKRSLGAEISDLWPTPPPPTAWARRQDILNQLPSSRFGRDMNAPRTQRFNSRNSQQGMRDITRPSVAEHWPLL